MHAEPPAVPLGRVSRLLAKAQAEGVTPPEAEALTAKTAELIVRCGIDRARLAHRPARHPPAGVPDHRHRQPWAQIRCQNLKKPSLSGGTRECRR